MKKAILITMLAILYVLSYNNSSNAQTSVNNQNNNAVNNQNNSSNAMYNQQLKKAPINIQTNANGRVKQEALQQFPLIWILNTMSLQGML